MKDIHKDDTNKIKIDEGECWYCNNYKYTLIFWSQSIQFKIQNNDPML